MHPESCISVSMSPIVDIAYTRAPAGEKCFDALIQEVRMNLSVPFIMHLTRYIMDSLPGEQIEEGIVNYAYESNNRTAVSACTRLPSLALSVNLSATVLNVDLLNKIEIISRNVSLLNQEQGYFRRRKR